MEQRRLPYTIELYIPFSLETLGSITQNAAWATTQLLSSTYIGEENTTRGINVHTVQQVRRL